MTRTVFAVAVAAMLMLPVSGASQAAPIAPLSGAVTADQSNVTRSIGIVTVGTTITGIAITVIAGAAITAACTAAGSSRAANRLL